MLDGVVSVAEVGGAQLGVQRRVDHAPAAAAAGGARSRESPSAPCAGQVNGR